ncbi:hypothetical protein Taro_034358 [Colocasia esculenta]|uniref:Uncharacterized protein n=1 Tax=Colocasia esculenta TaxID=4460 RepID=A0A843VXL0_COLES|nr:hypothetical protein [Colocasia esculenta]
MATLGLRRPGEQVSTLTNGTCPPPGFPPNALRGSVKTSLGSPKKVAEPPPNDLSSGLLDDLHAEGMSGKPSSLVQQPPCSRGTPDPGLGMSEKLASISLDVGMSVGIHVWTLTPPKRPGLDAKVVFGQNSKSCRKPCIPCIYICNIPIVLYPYYHHAIHTLFMLNTNTCTRNYTN